MMHEFKNVSVSKRGVSGEEGVKTRSLKYLPSWGKTVRIGLNTISSNDNGLHEDTGVVL